jgi:dihydroneopterin aldolase
MDILTLSGLQYHAGHGYFEQERTEGNDFEVDLIFYADLTDAGAADDLSQTIDYQRAEQAVCDVMEGPPVKLIETLAFRIGDRIFAQFTDLQKLTVRLRKLTPPMQTMVNFAQIERTWTR